MNKIMFKAQPSRITGLIVVLILLVSCSSTQSGEPTSLPPADSPLPFTPTFTAIPQTQKAVLSTPTSTSLPPSQPEIEVIKDIPYTSQLKLDVYKPSESGTWPVVVALHGSGQNKELFNIFSKRIAKLGAVVFTPNWHAAEPQGEQITREIIIEGNEDAACALRFARAKAADFGGNPSRIMVVGYSSGGTAGAVIALAGDDIDGDCLVSEGSGFPDAFVGVDGAYDLVKCCVPESLFIKGSPEDWVLLVPYTYLNREPIRVGVQFHLIAGGTEELAEMAETFHNLLKEVGYETTLSQFPELDHGEIVSVPLPELFGVIEDALHP